MSEPKTLNDFLKALVANTSLSDKSALIFDSQGNPYKKLASILGLTYSTSNGDGATLLGTSTKGYAIVFAFDTEDQSKVLIYAFSKPTASVSGTIHVLHSEGGLAIQATNVQGTVALKGYSASVNVVQHVIKFA